VTSATQALENGASVSIDDLIEQMQQQRRLFEQFAEAEVERMRVVADALGPAVEAQADAARAMAAAFGDPIAELRGAVESFLASAKPPGVFEQLDALGRQLTETSHFPTLEALGLVGTHEFAGLALPPLDDLTRTLDFSRELTGWASSLYLPSLHGASIQWISHIEAQGAESFQRTFGGRVAASIQRLGSARQDDGSDAHHDQERIRAVEDLTATVGGGARKQPPVVRHSRRELLQNGLTLVASVLWSEWRHRQDLEAHAARDRIATARHKHVVEVLESLQARGTSEIGVLTDDELRGLAVVKAKEVKLRSKPSRGAEVVQVMTCGSYVEVVSVRSSWTKVIAMDWVGGIQAAGWIPSETIHRLESGDSNS
jgi:hypothetical protein